MTARHDKATGGRTEAAAVDQAIACVRAGLDKGCTCGKTNHDLRGFDIDAYHDENDCRLCAALAALRVLADAVEEAATERDEALRGNWKQAPTDDGGYGKEESYWLRNKLRSAVVHLRDIEDFYRVLDGEPGSHYMARADRARSLYEQISEDFLNGRLGTPTMRERAEAAEAERDRLQRQLDAVDGHLPEWEDAPGGVGCVGRVQTILNLVADRAERDLLLSDPDNAAIKEWHVRLARQVADLEAALEELKQWALGSTTGRVSANGVEIRARAALAAARSRDPQEPQT